MNSFDLLSVCYVPSTVLNKKHPKTVLSSPLSQLQKCSSFSSFDTDEFAVFFNGRGAHYPGAVAWMKSFIFMSALGLIGAAVFPSLVTDSLFSWGYWGVKRSLRGLPGSFLSSLFWNVSLKTIFWFVFHKAKIGKKKEKNQPKTTAATTQTLNLLTPPKNQPNKIQWWWPQQQQKPSQFWCQLLLDNDSTAK